MDTGYKPQCFHCHKYFKQDSISLELYCSNVKETVGVGRKLFCNDACYADYLKTHFVEEFRGGKIYWFTMKQGQHSGMRVYIPYVGCQYYFLDIDECKKRMVDTTVTVVDKRVLGAMLGVML